MADTEAQTPHQRVIGNVCKRLLQEAQERRKRFEDSGREIMRYGYAPDYLFEYQNTNPNAWFKAKYAKTSEAFGIIKPRLMPSGVPNRMITTPNGSDDPALEARSKARMYYLNYAPRFTRWEYHRGKATLEAIGYGRGVLWTGRDSRTGLIGSTWVPVEDIWDDPNALTCDDRQMIIRQRIVPRYEAISEYPQAEAALMKLPKHDKDNRHNRGKQMPQTDDTIRFYEFYFLTGISGYSGSEEIVKGAAQKMGMAITNDQAKSVSMRDEGAPIKYLIDDNGTYLYECPWPIAFHNMVRDPWPCTFLDLLDNPQSIYPVSMLESGIGIQRAMNHLVTLAMGKMRHCMKVLYAVKKQDRSGLTREDIRRAIAGSDIEKIEVEFNGRVGKMEDFLSQFNWDMNWVSATQQFLGMLESIYERLTGMYTWLHTGQGQTQDRSAQATISRERNTMARIEEMRDQTREFDAIVASKECFAACSLLKPEDLAKVLPQNMQPQWGQLVSSQGKSPEYWLKQGIEQGIRDPAQLMQFAQEKLANAYTIDEIVYQSLFEIEAASTRRKDIDQQIEMMKEKMNTIVPVQLQSPDFSEKAIAYRTLALDAKLEGLPKEQENYYTQQADMYSQLSQGQLQIQLAQMQQQLMMAQMPPPMPGQPQPGQEQAPPQQPAMEGPPQ